MYRHMSLRIGNAHATLLVPGSRHDRYSTAIYCDQPLVR